MSWFTTLLCDIVLVTIVLVLYHYYQKHRRKQVEYARVQLYEDFDKPCACSCALPIALLPLSALLARFLSLCGDA